MRIKTDWLFILLGLVICSIFACRPEPLPFSDSGVVVVRFEPVLNGEPVEFDRGTTHDLNGQEVTFDEFKFYISNIALEDENGELTDLADIKLINFESLTTSTFKIGNLPLGTYNKIQFDLGVPPEENVSAWDPELYGGEHPLNDQAMYFQEAGSYKFMDLVGFVNEGGDPNIFTYGPGHNTIFQKKRSILNRIELTVESPYTIEIEVDMALLLRNINPIDEPKIQQSNNLTFGRRLLQNLKSAFSGV